MDRLLELKFITHINGWRTTRFFTRWITTGGGGTTPPRSNQPGEKTRSTPTVNFRPDPCAIAY